MNNAKKTKMNLRKALILTSLLITISYVQTFAQWYPRNAKPFYAGLVSRLGTRSLNLSSDLDDIKKMSLLQSGTSFGFMAGNRMFEVTANMGIFNASSGELKAPKLKDFEVNFEWEPLRFGTKKQKPFGIYLLAGLNNGSMKLSGSYTPPPKKELPILVCTCPLIGPPPPNPSDPDVVASDKPDAAPPKESYEGQVSTTRVNLGLGLQSIVAKNGRFLRLFAEVKYGAAISYKASNPILEKTKAASQLSIDFGMAVGIKKFHR